MSLLKLKQMVTSQLEDQGGSNSNPNPLRQSHTIKWFKRSQQCNEKYSDTVQEQMTVLQLKRLFERFDTDNSGAIDLSELRAMFETAGLLVSG
jgi:hypothetical protein